MTVTLVIAVLGCSFSAMCGESELRYAEPDAQACAAALERVIERGFHGGLPVIAARCEVSP